MSLKKSTGNMYPWVTHTHCHLGGECPHKCVYCYVDNPRFGRPERYKGSLRLIESEFDVNYGTGKTIFMENCNDLWANTVPQEFISKIVMHALKWPENNYVWQTKNPARYLTMDALLPNNSLFGCTIETNRHYEWVSKAPSPEERYIHMKALDQRKFITIEPIMDFDLDVLPVWIKEIGPEFVNIGADSKGHNLPEPSKKKVVSLIEGLKYYGIEIREKHNLERLIS